MEYFKNTSITGLFGSAANLWELWQKGKLNVEPISIVIVGVMSVVSLLLDFIYDAFYYYLMPFVPLMTVIMSAYFKRNSPYEWTPE